MLVYICNDCNATFCTDCVKQISAEELVCSECGHAGVEKNKNGKFSCQSCRSENIVSIPKNKQICPGCQSANISKIVDKTNDLRLNFKNIVLDTKNYLTPLEEKSEFIKNQISKLVGLRNDSMKIYHFPNVEMELLQLVKLFNNMKDAVQKKTVDFYDEINRNLRYFYNIETLAPKTLPIVNAICMNLESQSSENMNFIRDALARVEDRLTKVSVKIKFMEAIQSLFLEYTSLIEMDEDEKPVFGLRCKLDGAEQNETELSGKSGTILLTNKRLYFLHEKGLIKKKTTLLFSVLLEDLQTIQVEGTFSKKLSLEFANGMYKFKLNKDKRAQLSDFIEKAKAFDTNRIDPENLSALKAIQISIKPFRDSLEDAIFTLIEFRPKSENTNRNTTNYSVNEPGMSHIQSNVVQNRQVARTVNQGIGSMMQNPMDQKPQNLPPMVNSVRQDLPQYDQKRFPHLNKWFGPSSINSEVAEEYLTQDDYSDDNYCIQQNMNRNKNPISNNYPPEPNEEIRNLYDTYKRRPILSQEIVDRLECQNRKEPLRNYGYLKTQVREQYSPKNGNYVDYNPQTQDYGFNSQNDGLRSMGQTVFQNPIGYYPQTIPQNNPHNNLQKNMPSYAYPNEYEPGDALHNTLNKIRSNKGELPAKNLQDKFNVVENLEPGLLNSVSVNRSAETRGFERELRNTQFATHNQPSQQNQFRPDAQFNPMSQKYSNDSQRYSQPESETRYPRMNSAPNSILTMFPKSQSIQHPLAKPYEANQDPILPEIDFTKLGKPKSFAEELLKLQSQEFSIKRTIEILEIRRERGNITESEWLSKYQTLQEDLYRVQKQREKLEKLNQ